jgi:predicted metal-dependent hydrolase
MLKRLRPANGETIEVKVKGLELPFCSAAARGRRFSLQVSEARRGAILTMPVCRASRSDEFLSRHLDWLRRVATLGAGAFHAWRHRTAAWICPSDRFAGRCAAGVVWLEEADDTKVAPAWPHGARLPIRRLPRLIVAGEPEHAPRRMLDWMKRQAHLDLKARVMVHANRLDLMPARIFVRDQTTRWGSCSTSGALSFSWRLVLAPPFVLDYLAAHEVAHLGHMITGRVLEPRRAHHAASRGGCGCASTARACIARL